MGDVIIQRCSLRITRRGGWSWGAPPREIAERGIRQLAALLETSLARRFPEGDDLEIAQPLRVRVPIRLVDLLAGGAPGADAPDARDGAAEASAAELRVRQAIEAALDEALGQAQAAPARRGLLAGGGERGAPGGVEAEAGRDLPAELRWGVILQRLLLGFRARGQLPLLLGGFAPEALEAWHDALLGAASAPATPEDAEAISRVIEAQRAALGAARGDRAAVLRLRIILAIEVAAAAPAPPRAAALREALERYLPLPGGGGAAGGPSARGAEPADAAAAEPRAEAPITGSASASGSAAPPPHARPLAGGLSPAPPSRHRGAGGAAPATAIAVASALPYLLLAPLSQVGYLDALTASFAAAGRLDDLPRFAAALAGKVLPAPDRGRPRRAAVEASAVFAGLDEAPSERALADLGRALGPHLSPLDAVVARALLAGHRASEPFLLHPGDPTRPGLVLHEVEGVFPIAAVADLDALRGVLAEFEDPLLLIPGALAPLAPADGGAPIAFATPALLARADALGLRFVTDAPPSRGERRRALRRPPSARFWTNDLARPGPALLGAAARLEAAAEMASATWEALAARPVTPLDAAPDLDRSLSLAAALALGDISFRLWGRREPSFPRLALDRLGNLEATVRCEEGAVRVQIPLGRRYQDLLREGLLADVRGVPWLGGRTLRFGGG